MLRPEWVGAALSPVCELTLRPCFTILRVASASVRKAEKLENVGGRDGDVLGLRGSQCAQVTEPLLPQLLSGVLPDFG
jgi:hypothetical protein